VPYFFAKSEAKQSGPRKEPAGARARNAAEELNAGIREERERSHAQQEYQGTALLPSVSPTIDWVRLPQRFPVRIQVDSSAPTELRIGQTASVAISHGARIENTRIPA